MTPLFLTTTSAAVELGVTPRRVRAMITAGGLEATFFGRDWLIDPRALDAVRDRKPGRPVTKLQSLNSGTTRTRKKAGRRRM